MVSYSQDFGLIVSLNFGLQEHILNILYYFGVCLLLRSRIKQEFEIELFGTVALSEVLQGKLSPCE